MLSERRTHTHTCTDTESAFQEEAHCAERRSMEGSGHVRGGKTETSRRLFSTSPAPPLSRDSAGQCFAPGYNLPAQGIDTFLLRNLNNFWQKYCGKIATCCYPNAVCTKGSCEPNNLVLPAKKKKKITTSQLLPCFFYYHDYFTQSKCDFNQITL